MLFKSAKKPSLLQRLRIALWPRRSWSRSARYVYLRLRRLPSSPHRIAIGAGIGVFSVFTPFLGFQLLLAAALCLILRGSIVASFLASFIGNPVTYPMIWFSTYNIGNFLLGTDSPGTLRTFRKDAAAIWDSIVTLSPNALSNAVESIWPILKPMVLGSIPLGVMAALLAYAFTRRLIGAAKENRPPPTRFPAAANLLN